MESISSRLQRHRDGEVVLRIAHDVGAGAGIAAAVPDGAPAAVALHLQAEAVDGRLAARQRRRRLHRRDERRIADPRRGEVALPAQQIADGREQAGIAHDAAGLPRDAQRAVASARVAGRQLRHDLGHVVVEVRLPHAERPEDASVGEGAERLAADPLHDLGQQHVAAVVVRVAAARLVAQPALPGEQADQLIVHRAAGLGRGHLDQQERVAQAAGVREQVPDRHARRAGPLRQVTAHVVVDGQPAVPRQQQDAHRGELLGHRGDVEHGLRRDRHAELEAGAAVAALQDGRPAAAHADAAAGRVRTSATARTVDRRAPRWTRCPLVTSARAPCRRRSTQPSRSRPARTLRSAALAASAAPPAAAPPVLCAAGSIVAARMRTMIARLSRRRLLAASAVSIAAVALFRSVHARGHAGADACACAAISRRRRRRSRSR